MNIFNESHPHHAAHLSWGAAGAALILTLAYHFLLAGRYYGVGFVIFAFALVIVMHGMVILSGRTGNSWAYIFLLPALMCMAAEGMFANDVVRVAAPLLTAFSLALFSYWLMAPRMSLREVPALWSQSVFVESVATTQGGSGMFKQLSFGSQWKHILIGVGIALPFLFVISALFASADPLFRKTLSDILDIKSLPENFWKVIRDLVVAIYIGRFLWAMLTRATEQRKPTFGKWEFPINRTIIYTFLGLLNVLFLVFIGFQFVYFFGGEQLVQQQGITYSDYARQGFFQLLAVSVIVLAIGWFVYFQTEMRQWGTRGLMFALIAETGVVIVSAMKRVLLYVDTYGQTVMRLWAIIGICVIAFVLFMLVVSALAKWSHGALAKGLLIFSLYLFSGLLLFNMEAMVVRFNAARFVSHGYDRIDVAYFEKLSTDAVPAMVEFYRSNGAQPKVAEPYQITKYVEMEEGGYRYAQTNYEKHTFGQNLKDWDTKLQAFANADWRNAVWADRQALSALSTIK